MPTKPDAESDSRLPLGTKLLGIVCILMMGLATACYWPVVSGEFLWDDESLVTNNPYIRSPLLVGESFRNWLHPTSNSPYYRPIQTLSNAWDYYFWGQNPVGYHLTNIAFHAGCGVLLFYLVRALMQRHGVGAGTRQQLWIPLVVAAVWVIHPIHNAAVAYVSGRADSLCFLFASAAWLVALAAEARDGIRGVVGYIVAGALMLVAVCSKEVAAVWLALYFVHSLASKGVTWLGTFRRAVACIAILGVWLALRQLPVEPGLPAGTVVTSIPQRIVLVTRAIGDYAGLIVFPGELHMERMLWPEWTTSNTTWLSLPSHIGALGWVGILVFCCVIAGCITNRRGQALRIAGAIWFTIAFLPISNAFPLNAQVAEHWIYLASVGALAFLAGAFLMVPERLRKPALAAVALWALALTVRTNARAYEWGDPVRFYSQTIDAMGGTPRIFNNLGNALQKRGKLDESERVYRAGLKYFPNHPSILFNLGTLLARKEQVKESEKCFAQAAAIAGMRRGPGDDRVSSQAVATHAQVLIRRNEPQKALEFLDRAQSSPSENSWKLDRVRSEALVKLDRWDEAMKLVEARVQSAWWDQESRSVLARILERRGDLEQAEREWRMSARLDVWDPEPWSALTRIHTNRDDYHSALRYQRKVVERAPQHMEARLTLSALLKQIGETEEARMEFLNAKYLEAGGQL